MKIRVKNCPICNSKLINYGTVNGFKINKCKNCGLGITHQKDIVDYQQYHRDQTYQQYNQIFENIFQKRVNIITQHIKPPGKVLEIGSSTGILLKSLRDNGWRVTGVEPSKLAAQISVDRGIKTLIGNFEDLNFKSQKFDLVIMNHVLEHLDDPELVVEKIKSVLKSKGWLYIDVPNFGSFSSKLLKINWPYLMPEEHLWHFTYKSLEKLLGNHGFQVVEWQANSGIWDYGQPITGLWKDLINMRKSFIKSSITAIPDWWISKFKLGTGLSILSRII